MVFLNVSQRSSAGQIRSTPLRFAQGDKQMKIAASACRPPRNDRLFLTDFSTTVEMTFWYFITSFLRGMHV
jgi:hypothetical protein